MLNLQCMGLYLFGVAPETKCTVPSAATRAMVNAAGVIFWRADIYIYFFDCSYCTCKYAMHVLNFIKKTVPPTFFIICHFDFFFICHFDYERRN
jgi:hypothetical protein